MEQNLDGIKNKIREVSTKDDINIEEIIAILNDVSYFLESIEASIESAEKIKKEIEKIEKINAKQEKISTRQEKIEDNLFQNLFDRLNNEFENKIDDISQIIGKEIDENIDASVDNKIDEIMVNYLHSLTSFADNYSNFREKMKYISEFEEWIEYIKDHTEPLLDDINSKLGVRDEYVFQYVRDRLKEMDPFLEIKREIAALCENSFKNKQNLMHKGNFDHDITEIHTSITDKGYFIDEKTISNIVDALSDVRLVILDGAPGTGKTQLAKLISEFLTKSSPICQVVDGSWSKRNSFGGSTMKNNFLGPMLGEITKVIKRNIEGENVWLILDEINRADLNDYLGHFLNILDLENNGLSLDTLFDNEGKGNTLYFPNSFRIIGTMNTYDENSLFQIPKNMLRRIKIIELKKLPKEIEEKFIKYTFKKHIERINLGEHKSIYDSLCKNLIQVFQKIRDISEGENEWYFHDCNISNAIIINIIKKSINLLKSKPPEKTNLNEIIDMSFDLEFASKIDSNQPTVFTLLIDKVFKESIYPNTHQTILEKRKKNIF